MFGKGPSGVAEDVAERDVNLGLQSRCLCFGNLFRRRVQLLVGNDQPLDWPPAHDVRLDYFIHVFRTNVPIPNRFRVDHDRRPKLALIEAS